MPKAHAALFVAPLPSRASISWPALRFRARAAGLAIAGVVLAMAPAISQGSARDYKADPNHQQVAPEFLDGLEFESLNFSRGGRVTAVTGVRGNPLLYYMGASGGGVWQTTDAGNTWTNITDGQIGVGSIGAIAVAEADRNVIYVGTGSACPRGNISNGDGMYRSTDAGKTWSHVGIEDGGQIGRIRVHPGNPDVAYAAVLGNLFGPNEERGIFRTKDGGTTWERVLYISDRTGFVDLAMDAGNPRILYAAAWRAERKPWTIISGGDEGGLYKSTDGGDNWKKLEGGLPEGLVGRIGVTVSPKNPKRVWALIEAEGEKGGVYRSDDSGDSWRRINSDSNLRQRPWYYTHIYADSQDEDTVYALNTGMYRSVDGGQSFSGRIQVPHGDNHDLWINPDDPQNIINSNDGGANITFDGGESWTWQMNQPTSEIYRVFVDEQWPYRVYGPQQDNSTISIPSSGRVAWNREPPEWFSVGGCESGHIAVDPRNPDVVYAGCYGGSINRVDRESGERREIIAYPQLQLGQAPRDLKYRFQWNAPIRLSPHDPDTLYHTSQVVHRSRDEGQTWEVISPDLTYNDKEQQDYSGGPISHDSTGVEVYNTIFAFEESQQRKGELWAGSDDGRVHVSRDNGASWQEVTPKGLPKGATINHIEISAHDPNRLFIAAYRYRENDFKPYVYRSTNGGRNWKLLTDGNGIPATNFTRSVREDPVRQGLLFAGTEYGLYVSVDDGDHWQRFESKLPTTPVTDMRIHRDDLVVATQGRGFWILRDLSALRQYDRKAAESGLHLFAPKTAYRGGFSAATVHFHAAELPEEPVKLELLAASEQAEPIRSFEWKPGKKDEAPEGRGGGFFRGFGGGDDLEVEKGLNSFRLALRHKAPETPKGVVHWGFSPGVALTPGAYRVRLSSGDWSATENLELVRWPKMTATDQELTEQYDLGLKIAGRMGQLYGAINQIRDVKAQIKSVGQRLGKLKIENPELTELGKKITEGLDKVENQLTQTKSKSGQDPLNFPPQIDNQYVELYAYVVAADDRPPAGAYDRLADLEPELDRMLGELAEIVDRDIVAYNEQVAGLNLPAIVPSPDQDEDESETSEND